jgi:hypothetical protein
MHLDTDQQKQSYSVVVSGFVAAEMCLPRRCVASSATRASVDAPLLLRERVYRAVAQKRLCYICLFRGPYIVTALHATVH